jgi:hypothetical protein
MVGNERQVRLAAGGQAAVLDVNRYVTGFAEVKQTGDNWEIFENIDGNKRLIAEKQMLLPNLIGKKQGAAENLRALQESIGSAI